MDTMQPSSGGLPGQGSPLNTSIHVMPTGPADSNFPWAWVALLIALGAIFVAVYSYGPLTREGPKTQKANPTFLLRSDSGVTLYELAGDSIRPATAPTLSNKLPTIVTELAAALPIGTPVLASLRKGEEASLFGLIDATHRFNALYGNTHAIIRGLAVRADGLTAFAFSVSAMPKSLSDWKIGVVDSASTKFTDLGKGYAPAFALNGNVLALASEGFVEIHVPDGKRTVLIAAKDDFTGTFAVAPDGSFVIMKNKVTGTDDVFWVNSARPTDMSYLGSLPAMPLAVGVIDAKTFIAQTDVGNGTVYTVSKSGITAGKTVSVSK
ncbi:hypothetical protein HY090_00710 [Candidatus Kaiserbacteria bacterium]|nr:hypothetical protein [Candidatus Kaiserbacteria bacterium]